jgi:hypothetical protein
MVVKKIAKTEKIISELTSVRKLTRPNLSTSGWTPKLLFMVSLGPLCPVCRKQIHTMSQFVVHLADELLPLSEKLTAIRGGKRIPSRNSLAIAFKRAKL